MGGMAAIEPWQRAGGYFYLKTKESGSHRRRELRPAGKPRTRQIPDPTAHPATNHGFSLAR
jgi:hypothetical protein